MAHTCRFCKSDKKSRHRMVKYAARHWAHFDCWLDAKGKELRANPSERAVQNMLQDSLYGWQLEQFPVFKLADWLEVNGVEKTEGSRVDQACQILKTAISKLAAGFPSHRELPYRQSLTR